MTLTDAAAIQVLQTPEPELAVLFNRLKLGKNKADYFNKGCDGRCDHEADLFGLYAARYSDNDAEDD